MSKRIVSALAVLLAAVLILVPTVAAPHHGWSSYDASRTIEYTGPLTDLEWANPHSQAKINHQGKTWVVVLAPLIRMEQRGLTKAMLAPGKKVTLQGYPRSDGTLEMRIERVMVDGKTIELR
jgi:hypothetical protein